MEIQLRQATIDDIPAIHELVRELAIYEKEEAEFVATIEEYKTDFAAGIFEAIVAETSSDGVIGMSLFYMTYSTWKGRMLYLEDFVVKAAFRKKGVGQMLFDAFLETAKSKKCKLAKWQVLDWNEPALAFYRKIGATIEQNWWNGKLFLD